MREEILKITMTVDDEKVIGTATDQVRGPRGYSAYEVAVLLGYVGNEESWLESLRGDQGRSAYRVAVDEGFVGTVNEWRDSLIGPRGPVYDDSDLREQIDLELASLTRIASEAADVATTKAGEAVDAKNIVVLRADEVDGHAVILYGLFDEIEDYRQEVYSRALESIEQAGIATTKAGEAVISAGEAVQSAQDAAQSASEAEQTLNDKVSKSDIVQTKGQSTDNIMSQKAVTDLFNNLVPWLGSEIPDVNAVFDFEKSRFAVKGVPVGLPDISEFIRLSSATDGKFIEVQNNIPRISGEGLLIEEQRTNNFLWSEDMDNTYWTKGEGTIVTVNNVLSPRGDFTADTITLPDGFTGNVATCRSYGISVGQTVSIFIKSSSVISIRLGGTGSSNDARFDIQTGISTSGFSSVSHSITLLRNGWARLSVSGLSGLLVINVIDPTPIVAGTSLSLWGLQREVGSFTTSYIPTGGATATRSPDILNIPLLPSQTITGDWDAGVMYSVVDGLATFTGHGYIRNITVEEL